MRKVSQQNGQIDWIKECFKPLPARPKGWVTQKEVQQITGNSRSSVQEKLTEMIKAGEIQVIECLENGHRVKVYGKK